MFCPADHAGTEKVIDAAVGVVSGALPAVPGSRVPYGQEGPGLRLERVSTPFGLAMAADGAPGHLPGNSAAPLALASGRQSATAAFSAGGFRHRETNLLLAAGRVTGPKPFPEDEDACVQDTSGT